MTMLPDAAACLHACQEGCGRPYDIVVVLVVDGSTMFHCIPCHQGFIVSMTKAMVEPDDPQVQEVVAGADFSDVAVVDPNAPGYGFDIATYGPGPDDFEFDGTDES